MSQGGTFKPRHEVFESKDKFKLIVDSELQAQIAYLHNKHSNVEWCGMLFYDIEEGSLQDVSSIVVRAKRLYLIDVGTAGFTGGDLDEKLLDFYDEYPETMEMRMGFIHTHHGMSTFFSGTDMQELHDNTDKYNFYLSLIVNHKSEYCAKFATIGKGTSTVTYTYPGDDGEQPIVNEHTSESSGLFTFDADIEFDISAYFVERHEEVNKPVTYGFSGNYSSNQGYGQTGEQTSMGFQTPGVSGNQNENASAGSGPDTTAIHAAGSVEDELTLMELSQLPSDQLLTLFGIDVNFINKQSALKKIYNGDPASADKRLISVIIQEKIKEYNEGTPVEKKLMTEAASKAVVPTIIQDYGLGLLEDEVQGIVIECIANEIGEGLYKILTVSQIYNDFNRAITGKLDELAYLSQIPTD